VKWAHWSVERFAIEFASISKPNGPKEEYKPGFVVELDAAGSFRTIGATARFGKQNKGETIAIDPQEQKLVEAFAGVGSRCWFISKEKDLPLERLGKILDILEWEAGEAVDGCLKWAKDYGGAESGTLRDMEVANAMDRMQTLKLLQSIRLVVDVGVEQTSAKKPTPVANLERVDH
jgi:hypothetical protein